MFVAGVQGYSSEGCPERAVLTSEEKQLELQLRQMEQETAGLLNPALY